MGSARAAVAVFFLLVPLAGCGPGKVAIAWNITFETPALSARAVRVMASVHEGSDCGGAVRYAVSVPHGMVATTAPPSFRAGRYTVCADAIDDTCTVFASGHTTIDLRTMPMNVGVVVAGIALTPACPGSACDRGECTPVDAGVPDAGIPDADVDADAAPLDAAPDMPPDLSFDMGCPAHVVTPPSSPACDSWTDSCLSTCFDDACADGCIASDSSPSACRFCLDSAYDSCANANGCQGVSDTYYCCSGPCPDPASPSCCPAEGAALDSCFDMVSGACSSAVFVCFP